MAKKQINKKQPKKQKKLTPMQKEIKLLRNEITSIKKEIEEKKGVINTHFKLEDETHVSWAALKEIPVENQKIRFSKIGDDDSPHFGDYVVVSVLREMAALAEDEELMIDEYLAMGGTICFLRPLGIERKVIVEKYIERN